MLEIDGANIEVLNMNESMKQKKKKNVNLSNFHKRGDRVLPKGLCSPKPFGST
jgi:hypothetical protein